MNAQTPIACLRATEIAAMQADALAGTPGDWTWLEIDPADPDWGACEIWAGDDVISSNTFGPANARRIARVPRMEAAITALTAEIARLECALKTIQDAHPTGTSYTLMVDGSWREACRDFQRIARNALQVQP